MKRQFDVTNKYLTTHSCMYLIALSYGVHSHLAKLMVHRRVIMYSNAEIYEMVNGIMKSTFEHAKRALPGGGTMK